ncbi:hypothetical protein KSP39_PZI004258 [Platanthera zijinensis]|uniref:N-acetyltransferase domain-containing protein n=1 Tax=Platanthera zijinensis TaxID=2320716 RepID=A0AAP0BWE0_9ASPA
MAVAASGLRTIDLLCQACNEPCQRRSSPRCTWLALNKTKNTTLLTDRRLKTRASTETDLSIATGDYLVEEFGWGVRRMAEVGDEMRNAAAVQAEAFHVPVALFNDLFLAFFRAEVLYALIYKIRNSAPDRYACLVAESARVPDSLPATMEGLAGVVDCTVQRDEDVLRHLQGAEEYLYVSGIAVLSIFRRKKVGTVLLKACDVISQLWGHDYIALRAYEDDLAARQLYSKAGFKIVSADPHWITWLGRKRRLLLIKSPCL